MDLDPKELREDPTVLQLDNVRDLSDEADHFVPRTSRNTIIDVETQERTASLIHRLPSAARDLLPALLRQPLMEVAVESITGVLLPVQVPPKPLDRGLTPIMHRDHLLSPELPR